MKAKWTKQVPEEEGWYWVKYGGKNGLVVCPAMLVIVSKLPPKWICQTARNDTFPYSKQEDMMFGNKIEEPEN